ncbi:class I SAM-dependent methyltransferase [Salipaludibacillus sp. HK11]|uniref:class I SAM-dependent methyltransferase n=1 Tax=Salipaludibacillus sp. HK11 TaxID=3394320 RepID=UPI0039FCBC30
MKQNIYDNPVFFKGYKSLRDSGITYNDFVEQPAIQLLIEDMDGKFVLELGCGSGAFSKQCAEAGASFVTGADISKKMIAEAKRNNNDKKIEYKCMPMEDLMLPDDTFDFIISSLAIHYIQDYASLVKKISELLKPNGIFIFSIEHPICTARKEMDNWMKDENGDKLYYALDNYQEEGRREQHWFIDGVVKYHRTVSTIINTLIDNRLIVERMIEPVATPEGLEKMPGAGGEQRKPSFMIVKVRKSF